MPNRAPFDPAEIEKAAAARRVAGPARPVIGVSTDSRTVAAGELFVALRGPRFDGHDFIGEVFSRGAAAVVVDRWPLPGVEAVPPGSVFQVEETLTALGRLARFHRDRFSPELAAVTGSSGKSTTKHWLAHLLSRRKILATPGTQNNRIGVPMTLFHLEAGHTTAVLELGTNRWGEIRTLAEISRPTLGAVTNIGPAHLETFGDLRGVLKEKGGLWEALDRSAPVVLNGDDPLLREAGQKLKRPVLWFGTGADAQVRAADIRTSWNESRCRINGRWDLRLPVPGRHNVLNALAALACAQLLGENLEEAVGRLENAALLPGRLNQVEKEGVLILDDTYNANPASLQAALQLLQGMERPGRKIAVIGDMLELGERSKDLHAQAGITAAGAGLDLLVAVGRFSAFLLKGAREAGMPPEAGRLFQTPEEARSFLWDWVRPGDVVLVKGSRGMRMERVLECCTPSSIR